MNEEAELAAARRARQAPLRDLAGQAGSAVRASVRARLEAGAQNLTAAATDARIEQLMGGRRAQRAFFVLMAGRFDATKSAGFDGTIVFDLGLSDGTRNSWAAPVRDGRARARAAGAPDAALTVRAPLADFIRVSMGGGSLYPMIADGRSQQHEDAQVRREPAWPARLVHDELHIIAQSGYSGEVPTSIGTNRGDQA